MLRQESDPAVSSARASRAMRERPHAFATHRWGRFLRSTTSTSDHSSAFVQTTQELQEACAVREETEENQQKVRQCLRKGAEVDEYIVRRSSLRNVLPGLLPGWTPLTGAAACGNTKIVKLLLKEGQANPNLPTIQRQSCGGAHAYAKGTTGLHLACSRQDIRATEILCDAGADAGLADENGFTPIFDAIIGRNNLRLSGRNVNESSGTSAVGNDCRSHGSGWSGVYARIQEVQEDTWGESDIQSIWLLRRLIKRGNCPKCPRYSSQRNQANTQTLWGLGRSQEYIGSEQYS